MAGSLYKEQIEHFVDKKLSDYVALCGNFLVQYKIMHTLTGKAIPET